MRFQGCWRGCSAEESLEGGRRGSPQHHPHYYVHPHTPSFPPPTPPPSTSSASHHPPSLLHQQRHLQQQMPSGASCKGCGSSGCCWGSDLSASAATLTAPSAATSPGCSVSPHHTTTPPPPPPVPPLSLLQEEKAEEEEEEEEQPERSSSSRPPPPSSSSPSSAATSPCCCCCCSWWRRGRWRWGRCCQCPCGARCRRCSSSALMKGAASLGGGGGGGKTTPASQPVSTPSSCPTPVGGAAAAGATLNHHYPVPSPCPSVATTTATTTTTTAVSSRRARTKADEQEQQQQQPSGPPPASTSSVSPSSSASTLARTAASPKATRGGAPHAHPSLLTILLLLVVTLARFTDGCSSRSTPKPRPASPTMRPNITFQTYACPPAYAAWYCLNGATCFTVKIGESILYNCECADGYMGQRCEFKDLDGSYIPAREKVLLETASIAGGATVACVLVFIVLFAVYIFMQKDKDKRCRDLDDVRNSDRQPFSGYQNPRPEVFRTISNPYARTLDELSHVEVESAGHGINTGTGGRIGSGNSAGGGGGGGGGSGGEGRGDRRKSGRLKSPSQWQTAGSSVFANSFVVDGDFGKSNSRVHQKNLGERGEVVTIIASVVH
ncbi:uncharacterized protein [Macrobrachium rosenbergii]|uniref:uncharacterized protein isoform X2 n=1 Tax=Macrobrachium rosenbergii TaxID=79674 RepID=UPI0034D402A1